MNEQKIIEEWYKYVQYDTLNDEMIEKAAEESADYWLKVISDERAMLVEEIEKMKKDDTGGYSKYNELQCKWCGAEGGNYHKLPCKTVEKTIYNKALQDCIKIINELLER